MVKVAPKRFARCRMNLNANRCLAGTIRASSFEAAFSSETRQSGLPWFDGIGYGLLRNAV
jgi:hypothetical protein